MIRLLLVDDQPTLRRGLLMRLALEADIQVVGEAGSGSEGLLLCQRLLPDVVLMDVEMPGMDGITATERLHQILPKIAVVILSIYDDAFVQMQARKAGAVAFLGKNGSTERLIAAIRSAGRP